MYELSLALHKRFTKLMKDRHLVSLHVQSHRVMIGLDKGRPINLFDEVNTILGSDQSQYQIVFSTYIPNMVAGLTQSTVNQDPRTIHEIIQDQNQLHKEANYSRVISDYLEHPSVTEGISIDAITRYYSEQHVLIPITLAPFARHRNGGMLMVKVIKNVPPRRGRSTGRGK